MLFMLLHSSFLLVVVLVVVARDLQQLDLAAWQVELCLHGIDLAVLTSVQSAWFNAVSLRGASRSRASVREAV
jgi:hypothetical protein